MGGTKCTFRSCPIGTHKFPKMCFFHYPLKKSHIDQWIENADYSDIKLQPLNSAKNRVVCGLHFREECFMNYKRNRLTPWAVPTFDRLPTGEILDYSTGPNPKPSILLPSKAQHLIPPPGVLVWGQLPEFWNTYSTMKHNRLDTKSVEEIEDQEQTKFISKRIVDVEEFKIVPKKPRILNQQISTLALSDANFEINEATTISMEDENVEHVIDDLTTMDGDLDEEHQIEHTDNNDEDIEIISTERETVEEMVPKVEYLLLQKEIEERKRDADEKITALKTELAVVREDLHVSESIVAGWATQLKEYKHKILELEAQNEKLVKEKSVIPVKDVKTTVVTPASATPLTKAHFFNGIKKYLSASMTALVRMEMFGSSEREWKSDEKQVSVELLKLGENVFKYFRDEWRFRLPPKKLVQDWSNEVAEEEEEDL